jgi:outer membrane protein OmpA-like peptidoglycan-associated protein
MVGFWRATLAVLMAGAVGCATTTSSSSKGAATAELSEVVKLEGDHITVGETLLFEIGKADIEPKSTPVLDAVARILQETPDITKLTIEGYADSTGDDAFNKQLSQERANAVKTYVLGKGVAAARLEAVGMGTDRPVASNESEAGRAKNRRVEFKVAR